MSGDRLARWITEHGVAIVVCTLVLTAALGAGLANLDDSSSLEQFETESPEAEALATIDAQYGTADENLTTAQVVIRDEGGDVLTRESFLESLEFQQAIAEDERVAQTLAEEPVADLANVVATVAIQQERAGADLADGEFETAAVPETLADPQSVGAQVSAESHAEPAGTTGPSVEAQRAQLESMSEAEVETVVEGLLGDERNRGLYVFLPTEYEPGATTADARTLFVTQTTAERASYDGGAPAGIVDAQLAMADLVDAGFDDGFVIGTGIISDEIDRSMADSVAIVVPLALVFVAVVLTLAYRDPLDILLGLAGIVLVLVWTFGVMGWTGIAFNQLMVAVPVLLIGLSIDYAIHVFMRHREVRTGAGPGAAGSSGRAMGLALLGIGAALVFVTVAAVIGFLSNLVSPIGPIREFGLASAVGILAALIVYGVSVPAAKVELDERLEARGWDRRRRAFGTEGGRLSAALATGATAARRAPWAVVVLAVLLTAGGALGATQLDTSFSQEDFIADDPPEWTKSLPGPLATSDYAVKENLAYANDRFLRSDVRTQILVTGEVTDDRTLERVDDAHASAAERESVVVLAGGEANVVSPLSVAREVAAENESVAAVIEAADTTGDGVPDSDVEGVYDALFDAAPDRAADVVYRTDDGEYESIRLTLSVRGDADGGDVTADSRAVAGVLDGDGRQATATGPSIVFYLIEQDLLETVVQSLVVTFVAVLAFLMAGYRWRYGSATLGALTLLPILFGVAWILGTMHLLDVPFNVLTGTITSLTVGLGVAYNVHMTERVLLEREGGRIHAALERASRGTGGALLGSAGTTVGGFGVLVLAILPPLQQFGLITATTIVYAYLGSVFVLPSLLALWARHLDPEATADPARTESISPGADESE